VRSPDRSQGSGNATPGTDRAARRGGFPPKIPSEHKVRFTSVARKARALRKLGVSADQLASATKITPLLRAGGGLKAVLGAMRFSRDPVVKCFLEKRDSLGVWARENTPWEAIGLAAGIDLIRLLGAALLARWEHSMMAGQVIAIFNAPEVMKKRVEYAMLPGGWRDRDAIHKLILGLP
jgi:hypothetical protein